LFYENGTVYNQTLILNDKWKVDPTLLAQQGLPYYAGTWVTYLLCSNVALAATLTHLLLWNRDDLRAAWTWMNKNSIEEMVAKLDWRLWKEVKQEVPPDADIDPHYQEMLKVCLSFTPCRRIHKHLVFGYAKWFVQRIACAHHLLRCGD